MIDENTDLEVMQRVGERLRDYRLRREESLEDFAGRAGLHRNTVGAAERGENPRLLTLVKMLRALGRLDSLEAFLPAPPVSPLALARRQLTPPRQRVRAKKSAP